MSDDNTHDRLCAIFSRSPLFRGFGIHGDCISVYLDAEPTAAPMDRAASLQKVGDTLYLLFVGIAPESRGKGLGEQLYDLTIEAARALGCKRVVQTPSGKTHDGKPRWVYLMQRGWREWNRIEMMKDVPELAPPRET